MYFWECVILEQSFLSERLCIVEHKKKRLKYTASSYGRPLISGHAIDAATQRFFIWG